jgi:hypothetical protein
VAGVERSADVFGPGHHPDVPDLIVRFRQDLGLLDTCESARIGRVHVPVGSRWARRSGDHSPRTTVWMTSSELQPGGLRDDGALTDIAPTLLAAVGCDVDARMRGRTLLRG